MKRQSRAIFAAAALLLAGAAAPYAQADADKTPSADELFKAAKENGDRTDFNRFYSLILLTCGTDCHSYWIIDRRDGTVIGEPPGADPMGNGLEIDEIHTHADSDALEVSFIPWSGSDKAQGKCFSRNFRLVDHAFVATSPLTPMTCPN